MNTWPNGVRRALSQSDHNDWNNSNYPGTRQLCYKCDEPTGRCEEDSMNDDDGSTISWNEDIEWDRSKRVVYFRNTVFVTDDFGNLVFVPLSDVVLIYMSLLD